MTSWAGHRSSEFGIYPVELDFSLDSHSGPSWVVPALFNRSGWLSVAEVEMETEFDCTNAVIAACINDQGEVLGQWVIDALFSMQCSLPREVVTEPPDDLAAALDALYWDFLGSCDLAHLRALKEKEEEIASAIERLELRRRDVYEKVETFLSDLYARRRRERSRTDLRARIDAKIEEIEVKQAHTEAWHRDQLAALQGELEAFDEQVLSSLQNHGQFQPLYTVHWQTRHSKVRTIDTIGFQMQFGLPRPTTADIDIGSIELDARLHRMERLERKRREFADYYQALDDALEKARAQSWSLRSISEAVRENGKHSPPDKPNDTQKKRGRPRAAEASSKGKVSKGSAPPRIERPKIKYRPIPPAKPPVAAVAEAAAQPVKTPAETACKPAMAPEPHTHKSADADMTTPDRFDPLPAPSIDVPRERPANQIDFASIPADCVRPGDRVLLHYVDPPGARIWFWLTGDENNPARGILALHDERAVVLFGKRVGDRIGLLINQSHRVAKIERISRPDEAADT